MVEIKCQSCGAQTKELFEKGNNWVCIKCKRLSPTVRGHTVEARPPLGLGHGRITMAKKPPFCQNPHPDGGTKRNY